MPPDIRWQQRFANFCQALDQLETFFQLDGEAWLAMVQDRNITRCSTSCPNPCASTWPGWANG